MLFVKVISKPFCALLLRWVGGLLFLMLAQSASAVTWLQQISVPVALDYDTNARMVSTDAKSIWRSTITPHYSVTGVQGLNQWFAEANLRVERSSDQAVSLDREDPSLNFGWRHELETGQVGIRFGYDETSSRISQLDETGQSTGDNSRISKSFAIEGQQNLTDKLSLGMNVESKKMTFDGGGNPDSRSHSAGLTLSYLWDEKLEPYLQLMVNRYVPDTRAPATNFYSLATGVKWKVSDRLDVIVNGGKNKISGPAQDIGWQAGVEASYQAEKTNFTAGLSRSIKPSGNGGFIESDQIAGGWSCLMSDRSRTGIDLNIRKNNGGNQGEVYRISAWYERDLSAFWNLRASVLHKISDNVNQSASGNVLGLSLVYTYPDF